MKLAALRVLLALTGRLPLTVIRGLGTLIAIVPLGGRRARVRANLARAFPDRTDAERSTLARRNRRSMLKTALECGPLWHRSGEWLDRRWNAVEGRELLDAAIESGDGVLVVGGHLGHWEASILYGTRNLPITYLYKPPDKAALDDALTGYRSRFGGEFVATGTQTMRRALTRLRSGEAVGLLFDQLPKGGEFVDAPFFGQPVPTMTLAWRLARRTGCRVVMGHLLRVRTGWQPRFVDLSDIAFCEDSETAATRLNAALEQEVRRFPEQYLWRYRRFESISRSPDRSSARGV